MCKNILDIDCGNKVFFNAALTHPSYTKENNITDFSNYERLEFFGDSVLKLFSSQFLINKYPDYNEGELSRIRSILVSDATLAKIGLDIGIPQLIKLGDSEEKQGGRTRESNIACCMEALLGAYYLDNKQKEIQIFLEFQLSKYIEEIDTHFARFNAKAVLQEYTQSKTKELPEYKVVNISGPAHQPEFEIQVIYCGKIIGQAKGTSKKEAQQNCAYQACINLGIIKD